MRLEHLLSRAVHVENQPSMADTIQTPKQMRQSTQDDRALHAPPLVLAVCQFLDFQGPRMPSGTRQSEAAGIPNDSQESTIFDILRKVLSSEVDRDDARRTATGKSKSKT